jgi:hypothetical protein
MEPTTKLHPLSFLRNRDAPLRASPLKITLWNHNLLTIHGAILCNADDIGIA